MNGKRLQRWMKEAVKKSGLVVANWLYIKNLPGELHLQHRLSGKVKVLRVERRVG